MPQRPHIITLALSLATVGALAACTADPPAPAPAPEPVVRGAPLPEPQAPPDPPVPLQPQEEPPPPAGPFIEDARPIPTRPRDLRVPGYGDATFVGPATPAGPPPWAVVVALHGRDEEPEATCWIWRRVVGPRAWVLCPRGEPSEDRPGRFTFPDAHDLRTEVHVALDALHDRYPGLLNPDEVVLGGFSLGANLAPWIAATSPGRFAHLFLVEGGGRRMNARRVEELVMAGVRTLTFAMGVTWRAERAREQLLPLLEAAGISASLIAVKNAGHTYGAVLPHGGQEAFERLLGGAHAHAVRR